MPTQIFIDLNLDCCRIWMVWLLLPRRSGLVWEPKLMAKCAWRSWKSRFHKNKLCLIAKNILKLFHDRKQCDFCPKVPGSSCFNRVCLWEHGYQFLHFVEVWGRIWSQIVGFDPGWEFDNIVWQIVKKEKQGQLPSQSLVGGTYTLIQRMATPASKWWPLIGRTQTSTWFVT